MSEVKSSFITSEQSEMQPAPPTGEEEEEDDDNGGDNEENNEDYPCLNFIDMKGSSYILLCCSKEIHPQCQ